MNVQLRKCVYHASAYHSSQKRLSVLPKPQKPNWRQRKWLAKSGKLPWGYYLQQPWHLASKAASNYLSDPSIPNARAMMLETQLVLRFISTLDNTPKLIYEDSAYMLAVDGYLPPLSWSDLLNYYLLLSPLILIFATIDSHAVLHWRMISWLLAPAAVICVIRWQYQRYPSLPQLHLDNTVLFNRRTGKAEFYQVGQCIEFLPFIEFDAYRYQCSRWRKIYRLYLLHRYSDHEIMIDVADASSDGVQVYWEYLQQFMDTVRSLPDLPQFALFREFDPRSATKVPNKPVTS